MTEPELARDHGRESLEDILNLLDLRPAWQTRAVCRDKPDVFFPLLPGGHIPHGDHPIHDAAKAICQRCPDVKACLSWALKLNCSDGVFGGMNPAERRKYVNRQRVQKHRNKVRSEGGAA